MSETSAMAGKLSLLTALQHGDSQFPGGSFAFSWGLETLQADGHLDRAGFAAFLGGQMTGRWASFDRLFVGHAHAKAGDATALGIDDDLLDAMLVGETQRLGSIRAGGSLLLVHAQLGTPGVASYRRLVLAGEVQGHLPIVQGLVLAGVGLGLMETLLVAAYQTAAAFCSAATRLGLISHLDGQRALLACRAEIAAAADPSLPPLSAATSFTPLADMAMMRHASQSGRLFAS
ncbi:urease accessory protein [Arboricoccus pini]|uniref:Urease accessory protein UreF n=1 Tax=Arboricoccus pini TaxID=1963835 RepID=A0A212S360_9PROT|nr:urease accessory UreF family protein [Arboricoccus pini]SNB79536.1 urease accessory protein [Arboricoccus pini]